MAGHRLISCPCSYQCTLPQLDFNPGFTNPVGCRLMSAPLSYQPSILSALDSTFLSCAISVYNNH